MANAKNSSRKKGVSPTKSVLMTGGADEMSNVASEILEVVPTRALASHREAGVSMNEKEGDAAVSEPSSDDVQDIPSLTGADIAVSGVAALVMTCCPSPIAFANTPPVGRTFGPTGQSDYTINVDADLVTNSDVRYEDGVRPLRYLDIPVAEARALRMARAFAANWTALMLSAVRTTKRPPDSAPDTEYSAYVYDSFHLLRFVELMQCRFAQSFGPLSARIKALIASHAVYITAYARSSLANRTEAATSAMRDSWAGATDAQYFASTLRGQVTALVIRALTHVAFVMYQGQASNLVLRDSQPPARDGYYTGTIYGLYSRLEFTPENDPVMAVCGVPFLSHDNSQDRDSVRLATYAGEAIGVQHLRYRCIALGELSADLPAYAGPPSELRINEKESLLIPQPGCYVIVGGPRSGKTTLINELADRPTSSGGRPHLVRWGERDTIMNTLPVFSDSVDKALYSGATVVLIDFLRMFAEYGAKLQARGVSRLIWLVLTQLVTRARATNTVLVVALSLSSSLDISEADNDFVKQIAAAVDSSATGYIMLRQDKKGTRVIEGYVAGAGARVPAIINALEADLTSGSAQVPASNPAPKVNDQTLAYAATPKESQTDTSKGRVDLTKAAANARDLQRQREMALRTNRATPVIEPDDTTPTEQEPVDPDEIKMGARKPKPRTAPSIS